MSIVLRNKLISETPGEMAEKIKKEMNLKKISYCGKLDPMSRGIMLFLTNEMCKKQDLYLKMDKIYEFEILFGFKTDTYDILGLIDKVEKIENNNLFNIEKIIEFTNNLVGKHEQKFPPYSSICVANKEGLRKPLWWWSKNNRLDEIIMPSKKIEIYSMNFLKNEKRKFREILPIIVERISKVNGDFRQKKILEIWKKHYDKNKEKEFHILRFKTEVSSGTYIRSIIQKIAKKFNTSAIAFDINRKKIGIYDIIKNT